MAIYEMWGLLTRGFAISESSFWMKKKEEDRKRLWILGLVQERQRQINLRKMPRTPAGWETRWDRQGSSGRCPRDLVLFAIEKLTEKGIFARTPRDTRPSVPGTPRPSRGFAEIFFNDFFLCAFSSLLVWCWGVSSLN